MKTMFASLASLPLHVVGELESTQDAVAAALLEGPWTYAGLLARHQTAGRGRLDRNWHSTEGESLTMTIAIPGAANHPQPWLIAMAVACAAAAAVHARVQWPNDLVLGGRKVGGILTEIRTDHTGNRVPVIGIGLNLNQTSFPDELADRATSLHLNQRGGPFEPETVAHQILDRIGLLPEVNGWPDLRSMWMLLDVTPGKRYTLPTSEVAIAIGIGSSGELICSVEGETQVVLAADALFGGENYKS